MKLKRIINRSGVFLNPFLIMVLPVFLIYSCKERATNSMITGKDYKLWQKVDADEEKRGTTTYYYFDSEGKFSYYKKYLRSNKIEKLDMGDVVLIETWKLLNDSSMQVSNKDYIIKKLNDTCLIYVSKSPSFKNDVNLVYRGDRLD